MITITFNFEMMNVIKINVNAIISPGIIPDINIFPTETPAPANAANTIIGTLGGIMGPMIEADCVNAAEKGAG